MVREQDYWIYAFGLSSSILLAAGLYMGTSNLRVILVAMGLGGAIFIAKIMRKNYSDRAAVLALLSCLTISIALSLAAYFLTN